jgi:hypothetical protein
VNPAEGGKEGVPGYQEGKTAACKALIRRFTANRKSKAGCDEKEYEL